MRHLWSFLLSLLLTPLIYISAGFSAVKFSQATGLGLEAVLALAGAFVAGGLFALLVMARLSPVGPIFGALVFLGVTLWALLDAESFTSAIPADLLGQKNLLHVPVGFGTALLAAPLLFTVFSPRRWRGSETAGVPTYDAAPDYPPPPTTAAPAYHPDTTLSNIPTYEPPVYTPPGGYSGFSSGGGFSPPSPFEPRG
jgi:hypothetical protein